MISKYVNPFTDFGFKKIFGEEGSKFLLMDFLNTLLPEENKISSLTLKNSENLPRTELERRAIFDIYCMNQKGERFIVELQKSKENKEIISIWQYNGDKGSIVGYVTEISEEYIGFRHFNRFGKQDGVMFIKLANIKTIDFNDDYTRVMECLIQYADIIDKPSDFNINLNHSDYWQFKAIMQLHNAKDQIASIEINGNDYFTGFVPFFLHGNRPFVYRYFVYHF